MTIDETGAAGVDPRPLTGEPLPMELLNTRWCDNGLWYDLLETPDGLRLWLDSAGFADTVPHTRETLEALFVTRAALAALVDEEADHEQAVTDLNESLRHGRLHRRLGPDGPVTVVDTDSPGWLPAWTAAEAYLRLLEENPDRIRKCANPECVLHFYDVSKNGARRWCSMALCGNRTKSRRHYARHKETPPAAQAN